VELTVANRRLATAYHERVQSESCRARVQVVVPQFGLRVQLLPLYGKKRADNRVLR